MDRHVVVLGTDHRIQGAQGLGVDKKIDHPTYVVLIEKLVKDFLVDYIFEEASGLGPTAASKLGSLTMGYLDVDPPGDERQLYGIPMPQAPFFEDYVIYEINDPNMPKPEPFATIKYLPTHLGREKVWVDRINEESFKHGLMICGAAHTFSVARRLEESGSSVEVIIYKPDLKK